MSTVRRLFDDPRNTQTINGQHVSVCCDNNAPYWDTYRIRDTDDAWSSRDSERNMPAYKTSDSILVRDLTGASDGDHEVVTYDLNGHTTGTNGQMRGYVRVEGPSSGYRPDFLDQNEWMAWQGVEFQDGIWRRTRIRDDKVRWGKGPGGWASDGIMLLWCQKCETGLEAAWSDTLKVLPIACRALSMVVSYVPVFGTAISFVVNATVSLAQGEPIDQAVLDGIGGALPGQPTSGMVFNAGVAIAKGERIDHVAIDALPISKEAKVVLKAADDVVYGILNGDNVPEVAYQAIYNRMPPDVKQGMGYARRIINGENVPEMILSQIEQAVVSRVRNEAETLLSDAKKEADILLADAKNRGQQYVDAARQKYNEIVGRADGAVQALYNQYAAETGYQLALEKLDVMHRDGVSTGLAVGSYSSAKKFESERSIFGVSVPEKNVAQNETYLQKGQRIIDSGAAYRFRALKGILAGDTFSVNVMMQSGVDLRAGMLEKRLMTYKITDAWRRGFIIAVGVCEGSSQDGPGQLAVYQSMAETGGRDGFNAGQAVQWDRTLNGNTGINMATLKMADSPTLAYLSASTPMPKPIDYIPQKDVELFTPAGQAKARALSLQEHAQRLAARQAWVAHYMQANSVPGQSGTMTG